MSGALPAGGTNGAPCSVGHAASVPMTVTVRSAISDLDIMPVLLLMRALAPSCRRLAGGDFIRGFHSKVFAAPGVLLLLKAAPARATVRSTHGRLSGALSRRGGRQCSKRGRHEMSPRHPEVHARHER